MHNNPEFLGNWMMALGFVTVIAMNFMALLRSRGAEKRESTFATNFATTSQLDELEAELGKRIEKIDGDLRGLKESIIANGEKRRESIEAKVEGVRREAAGGVSQLNDRIGLLAVQLGKVEGHLQDSHAVTSQHIVNLNQKLERFIERETERHRIHPNLQPKTKDHEH